MAMALPQTEEKDHFGSPSYRVQPSGCGISHDRA